MPPRQLNFEAAFADRSDSSMPILGYHDVLDAIVGVLAVHSVRRAPRAIARAQLDALVHEVHARPDADDARVVLADALLAASDSNSLCVVLNLPIARSASGTPRSRASRRRLGPRSRVKDGSRLAFAAARPRASSPLEVVMNWPATIAVSAVVFLLRLLWKRSQEAEFGPPPDRFLPDALPVPVLEPAPAPAREALPRPHQALGTAMDGEFISITGRIQRSTGTLIAPLSGTECVAYSAYARSTPDHRYTPSGIDLRETKIAPLVIEVAGGTVSIDGECTLRLQHAPLWAHHIVRETAFLAKHQLERFLPVAAFSEAVLQVGDQVSISGVLVSDIGGEHGYRDRPLQLRLEARPDQVLVLVRASAVTPRARSRQRY